MKKMIILLTATMMCVTVRAQEDKPFVTADISTQASSEFFHGAGVSLGAGYNLKGVDMGLSLDYYSDGWGRDGISSISYMDNGTSATLGSILTLKGYDFNITHNWAVGAFFEEFMLVRERDIMYLHARYSF